MSELTLLVLRIGFLLLLWSFVFAIVYAALGKSLRGPRALVDVEIVEDHHIAGRKTRRQLRAHVDVKGRAIHRPLDDPGCDQLVTAQARHKGLSVPLAEGRVGPQPFAAKAAAAQRRHVGFHTDLVDEDKPRRQSAHEGLAAIAPLSPGRLHVRAFLLRCQQRFFYR